MKKYVERLYDQLTDAKFMEQCLTTVIICGPPPPKPHVYVLRNMEYFQNLGAEGLALREAWCDEVVQLCIDRFGISYGNIGDFIMVLDIWWNETKEQGNDGIQDKIVSRLTGP